MALLITDDCINWSVSDSHLTVMAQGFYAFPIAQNHVLQLNRNTESKTWQRSPNAKELGKPR
ncbi:hypothetical protein [Cupriavidus pauculus]|uniref:hypothetical protein n=1 Tax=Cupriavidus pauculus TaxID=82633 RepID=UPI0012464A93|nr:hypothetical protein [Cupriavidus pauculus]KAB0598072.1 hypothetical protein F7R19_25975 [Cupriavidus pauculus]UAK98475.1 hypothetical protein K8O84_10570 [Cupriavidus pauculus]